MDSVSGTARKIQAEITGIGTSVGAVGRILQGIGQGIGQAIASTFSNLIGTISSAIPNLLERGHEYLDLLHGIQLETGMTAEQTSSLVGAFRALGVPIDNIQQLFARFASNLASNEDRFRELGIATRDSNGAMLDSYTIFQNVRRAVQEHGSSLLSTAAIQELFGRSGYKIVEALQASDEEWARATENVRRWGGVVSQAAIAGADRLSDTLQSFWQGVTDIGTNIAAAVDPYLRTFVDAFARFVQSHLNEIINFAVGVVNVVTGFISGLFGITDALDTSAETTAASTTKASAATDDWGKKLTTAKVGADAFTTSINAQIKAIDAHIAAVEKAAERRRAAQERARLADSLAAAQSQLADLRGNAPFLGGLSAAEQALAVQKHAQDIIDAEQNVQDQRQAIGDFEADQKDRAETELLNRQKSRLQEQLAAHKAANAEILQSGLQMGADLQQGMGTVLGNLGLRAQEFGKTAASSFATGVAAAKGFLDILLGAERTAGDRGEKSFRTGGLVGAIGAVGGALGGLGQFFGQVIGGILTLEGWLNGLQGAFYAAGRAVRGFIEDLLSRLTGGKTPKVNEPIYPRYAAGGYVPATVGGRNVNVAEGGEGEWIIPESRMPRGGGGNVTHIHFDFLSMPTDSQLRELTQKISRLMALEFSQSPVSSLASGSF